MYARIKHNRNGKVNVVVSSVEHVESVALTLNASRSVRMHCVNTDKKLKKPYMLDNFKAGRLVVGQSHSKFHAIAAVCGLFVEEPGVNL